MPANKKMNKKAELKKAMKEYLRKYGIESKIRYFRIQKRVASIYRGDDALPPEDVHIFKIYYKDEHCTTTHQDDAIENSIKFIFSGLWLTNQLFNIVCKIKKKKY